MLDVGGDFQARAKPSSPSWPKQGNEPGNSHGLRPTCPPPMSPPHCPNRPRRLRRRIAPARIAVPPTRTLRQPRRPQLRARLQFLIHQFLIHPLRTHPLRIT